MGSKEENSNDCYSVSHSSEYADNYFSDQFHFSQP